MELLTLAALEHLPTSVLYVMDLTEECGTSLQDQWDIRWVVCVCVCPEVSVRVCVCARARAK